MTRQSTIVAYQNNVKRRRWRKRLVVSGTPVLTATLAVPYAGFAMSATGGDQPYRFVVVYGAFPDGISVDPETGAVSGTPIEEGTFVVTLGVRDDLNKVALLPTFTLEVAQ